MDIRDVCDFIKSCKIFCIATAEGDQPHVRVFGTVNIFEDRLYVLTARSKNVSKQLAANPKVEICAFNGDKEWIRVTGSLYEDDRVEARKAMLDAYPELRGMYDENDGNMQVFCFRHAKAVLSSFVKPDETAEF
jgi:uncharacterized pyridoxamine 5'-phosphate oxidase family protein